MATETVVFGADRATTLTGMIRPGLRALFAKARDAAGSELECRGWTTMTMPGPYAPSLEVTRQMAAIRARLG